MNNIDNLKAQIRSIEAKKLLANEVGKKKLQEHITRLENKIKSLENKSADTTLRPKEEDKQLSRVPLCTPAGFACHFSKPPQKPPTPTCETVIKHIESICSKKQTVRDAYDKKANTVYLLSATGRREIKNTCLKNFSVDAIRAQKLDTFDKENRDKTVVFNFSNNIVYDSFRKESAGSKTVNLFRETSKEEKDKLPVKPRKADLDNPDPTKRYDGDDDYVIGHFYESDSEEWFKNFYGGFDRAKHLVTTSVNAVPALKETVEGMSLKDLEGRLDFISNKLDQVQRNYNSFSDLAKKPLVLTDVPVPPKIQMLTNMSWAGLKDFPGRSGSLHWGQYRKLVRGLSDDASKLSAYKTYYNQLRPIVEKNKALIKNAITKWSAYKNNNKAAYREIQRQLNFDAGHRDALQLIPEDEQVFGRLNDVVIKNNIMHSVDKMQGPFSSDGVFKNLQIFCNIIDTNAKAEARLRFNGMLSGMIYDNYDAKGGLVPPVLQPVRLGAGENVWVVSFDAASIKGGWDYIPIRSPSGELNENEVIDNRRKPRGGHNLFNFNVAEFIKRREAAKKVAGYKPGVFIKTMKANKGAGFLSGNTPIATKVTVI